VTASRLKLLLRLGSPRIRLPLVDLTRVKAEWIQFAKGKDMTANRPAALIVEDQPFIGMVASDILHESGFNTFHAFDASDAVTQLRDHPEIELMIVEAALPSGGDGIDFAARVAIDHPDVQLLIAAERGHEFSTALPAGARLLTKPFASGELKVLVAARELA
jgi:DNA-binding response OmpR family regulator